MILTIKIFTCTTLTTRPRPWCRSNAKHQSAKLQRLQLEGWRLLQSITDTLSSTVNPQPPSVSQFTLITDRPTDHNTWLQHRLQRLSPSIFSQAESLSSTQSISRSTKQQNTHHTLCPKQEQLTEQCQCQPIIHTSTGEILCLNY